MNRRTLLRRTSVAGIGIAALAGCSSPDGGDGTEPAVDTETEEEEDGEETETEMGEETEAGAGEGTETEMGEETEAGAGEGTETEMGEETGTAEGTDAAGGAGGGGNAYEFNGVTEAWMGVSPSEIEGEENPTLQLTAGEEYEVTWTNGDGVAHDFTIQDSDGNNLEQTDLISEEGQSATLTFTASEEMTTYICTVHPNTMVGDLEVSA
ncbi:cupredoxin domain-containing protein [Halorarum salinum]|uniref:Plastocyanin n=1 Tax=Halorarum salinum TaxID=2743089 RepID=A0A7D5LDH9_9EURY|nr:plastocyanin/azurin family copper-binding protein [Halobaculum salinum]QLG64192.1 plastocyanin [Halobaculum salinum]